MLRLSDNPPILYPESASLAEMSGRWWVAQTKSRHEKALAWSLQQMGIGYFLPLTEKVHRRKGRNYKCLLPLFSGYLFFCGDQQQRYLAQTGNRIAQVIDVVDQQGLIRDMSQVYQALCQGAALEPHRYLKAGDRCRVVVGPLIGLEGIFLQRRGVSRLVLQVDMLGQAASVEVDDDVVESIST